jgi:hypothetical protein
VKWEERTTVQKGTIAEELVCNWFLAKGVQPYRPAPGGPHKVDFLLIEPNGRFRGLDVKAKAARNRYPDTGIDLRHFFEYRDLEINYGTPMFLAFVDEAAGCFYGNHLEQLVVPRLIFVASRGREVQYPLVDDKNQLVFFPLAAMQKMGEIPLETVSRLRDLSTRKYPYAPVQESA